ncbi:MULTISPECIES: dihydroorotase [Salinibaculum]|uniref:dihydroorotase n=1 Tax=Salinibaculum TaxID=2732368 RepID=UPI003606CA09
MGIDTVISNGTLVWADRTRECDLAIDGEKIVAVGDRETFPSATEEIDASGNYVLPGLVDPHVHLECYYSQDSYESGTRAAALGGVTTCIAFAWQAWANDAPDSMSTFEEDGTLLEAIDRHKRRGEDALVDFGLHGGITRPDPAVYDELGDAVSEGVTSFKMFTTYEIGLSNGFLDKLFEEIAEHDGIAVLHTEDDDVCEARTERLKDQGRGDVEDYPGTRPAFAEAMAADDAVRMAREAGVQYYGFHTSCGAAGDVLADAQDDGTQIRAETCPHYLTLDQSAYETQGTLAMIAPPLRTQRDIEALFDHLERDTLSVISTDHTSFQKYKKEVDDWWDSTFGANSVQRSLPVFHDEAIVSRDYSYPFLVRLMCTRPAETFGLPNKGTLDPGTDADVVIFDPDATQTIRAADNESVSDYSIYEGREVVGQVETTLVRGSVVADGGEIKREPGYGNFIERECPDWEPL